MNVFLIKQCKYDEYKNFFKSWILCFINYQSNTSKESWRISESNRWPPACKAGALASWANPPLCEIQNVEFRISNDEVMNSQLLKFPFKIYKWTYFLVVSLHYKVIRINSLLCTSYFVLNCSLRQTPLDCARDKLLVCLSTCSLRQTRTADLYIISVAL